ncbi:amidohydrolase family protein [uncultured Hyphomonas sp.]|jgi:predicted TIM-barrel fold metal-dependent hydrolase|uniref:amidohydrolase family protein n=1 Tax=uncultured Hyphomonas sp. TaxID=225298 RepID=UPI000C4489D0|nr:amidohydrolase [Hyphomonadaceae bacterium]|tara:strand:- start:37217 stop:38407 length:1191 start_codon:yes stop_codon:yes gene_type:complete
MTYASGRLIHDADSHLMEPVDCLDPYFDKRLLARFRETPQMRELLAGRAEWIRERLDLQSDAEFRADADGELMVRKNYEAQGAWLRDDRPHALDGLGFASQLVFTTHCLGNFGLDQGDDMDLCYAAADAHNRMMTDFCSVDPRLLPVAYIPLEEFHRTLASAKLAIELGAKALMVPSRCPQNHAPSHIALDPLWAMAEEAGLPVVLHVGGETKLNPVYKKNGLPPVPDFHGGDDNFTSVSYMPIPEAAMQTLATLIFDGVFDRFPNLKWGAIELGASWLPGWMRSLDSAAHAFMRNEERLQNLSAKPSEIVRRQLRVAPYPHEDAGWIIANAGEEVCMFSSDYPHVEGGRNPLKRFDESLKGTSARGVERFYSENFIDLMGDGLSPELRHPAMMPA